MPDLGGVAWAKFRRLLLRRESFTFLDQVQGRLAGLGLDPDVLSALLGLEGLRRQPWRLSGASRALALVRTVYLNQACRDWPKKARQVRMVLDGVWRTSSLVEYVSKGLCDQATLRRLGLTPPEKKLTHEQIADIIGREFTKQAKKLTPEKILQQVRAKYGV